MNVNDFNDKMIEFNSIDEILDMCETYGNKKNIQGNKGNIFERIGNTTVKTGFWDIFPNSQFSHMIGNVNNGKLKTLESFNEYLNEKVNSGNSSGCSDITLYDKINNKYIFISSKYPKTQQDIKKQKSVDYYDIQNIIAMINKNKHIYKDFEIYLLVPDKKLVLEKVLNANKSSNYITKYMTEDKIIDKSDLNKYFLKFKSEIIKQKSLNVKINYDELFLGEKENLNLRFHQDLITSKTSSLVEEGHKCFLWGCKCRSGKTYMTGGIIIKQYEIKQKLNVLIITPAPTETSPQFTDDLFNKFRDFSLFKIHNIEGSKELSSIELDKNNIFVMSKQLLEEYIEGRTIQIIKNLKLDLIIFDESHFQGCTDLSKSIINSYSSKNTIKIFLTATYNKPLKEWDISSDCQMFWDIEDEQICKSILLDETNINKLVEKHGVYVKTTINKLNKLGLTNNDIFKSYKNMPNLHLITNMFDEQRYEIIKERISNDNKMGFCFDTLFGLNKNKTQFLFHNEVKTILRYISSSNESDGEKTIFKRIYKLCSENESRNPFTQIWFLPPNNINEISLCLTKLMLEDDVLKHYAVLCINRKNKKLAKDVKEDIIKCEIEARSKGKRGLILLAGSMLTLGITLNSCDIVLLLNNSLTSDKVLQQMYRCMTEGINNDKKMGIVVDLNISRVLNTCINYTIYKNSNSVEDKIKYLIENHLINIDIDMMKNRNLDCDGIVKKLMDIWKSDPINHFLKALEHLKNEIIEFDNPTQRKINKYFSNSINEKNVRATVEFKEDGEELQVLPKGQERIPNGLLSEKSDNSDSTEDEEEKQILFQKDVLPFVIPLTCILTIHNENKDFVKMLNDIKNNKELLEIFDDQCQIWWDKKGLINIIKDIIENNFEKNSSTFNISVNFKMNIQSLIDRPTELLKLINECLKPKQKEKQENGEVFTPMNLVNEMLDNLDKHYIKLHNKSIFSYPNFKWFDPATGMSNFPVAVYMRLMIGLKDQIPDDLQRKKHIIENMLYMSELNKKNVFITKQIFNLNNEYNMKLYEGDTLELNIVKQWEIPFKSFDVVLGNPPYNKGGIWSHTKQMIGEKREVLWMDFITKSFNEWLKPNGFLLFINPLYWLKINNEIHNDMLEKHIVWMKLWDNIKSLATINGKIPISLFILHNKLNVDKYKTEIISEIQSKKLITISNEYLNKDYSVPLAYHSIFNKLVNFIETKKLKLEYKTKTIKSTGTKMKIPLNYKVEDMWAVDTYTIKEGLMVKKASEEHPDKTKRKLIIANKASFTGAFIDEGKLNLTGCNKYYITGEKLDTLLKMFNFKIINIITHFTKYTQDFLDKEAFKYIPDIRKLNIDNIEELDFYKLIGLADEEIKLFKNTQVPVSNDEDNSDSEIEEEIIIKSKKIVRKKKNIEVNNELIEVKPKKIIKKKSIIEPLNNDISVSNIDILVKTPVKRKSVKKNIISSNDNNITI